jgi:hypothetical protein
MRYLELSELPPYLVELPLQKEDKLALGCEAAEVAFLLDIDVGPLNLFEGCYLELDGEEKVEEVGRAKELRLIAGEDLEDLVDENGVPGDHINPEFLENCEVLRMTEVQVLNERDRKLPHWRALLTKIISCAFTIN